MCRHCCRQLAAAAPFTHGAFLAGHILHDHQALAKALEVVDFTLAQEAKRVDDIRVIRQPHQVLVGDAGLLLCCYRVKTIKSSSGFL